MAKPPLSSFLISAIAEPQKRQQTVHYLFVERSFGSVKNIFTYNVYSFLIVQIISHLLQVIFY